MWRELQDSFHGRLNKPADTVGESPASLGILMFPVVLLQENRVSWGWDPTTNGRKETDGTTQAPKLSPRRCHLGGTPTVPLFIQHPRVLEEVMRMDDVLGSSLSCGPFKVIALKLSLTWCLKGKRSLLLPASVFVGLVVFPFKTLFFQIEV